MSDITDKWIRKTYSINRETQKKYWLLPKYLTTLIFLGKFLRICKLSNYTTKIRKHVLCAHFRLKDSSTVIHIKST